MGERLLWYIPNRVLDFADIFRLRIRVGPGLGATLRATDYLHFCGGHYRSVFLGLPGPRYPYRWRVPYGRENQNGLIWCGIDATDDLPNPPGYSPSEFDIGAHILLAGAEFGFDIVELVDFLGGFVFLDPGADDHELWNPDTPAKAQHYSQDHAPTNKPETFSTFAQRLEYTRTEFIADLNERSEQFDAIFAHEGEPPRPSADKSNLRMVTYVEVKEDNGVAVKVDPDFDLEVSLPNLERRWWLFVSGENIDELPGTSPTENDDPVLVGVRKGMREINVKADVGVQMSWSPEAFARIRWVPVIPIDRGAIMPGISGFYESDDGLGAIGTVVAERCLDEGLRHILRSTSSARYTVNRDAWAVEQGLFYGFIREMISEDQRGLPGLGSKHMARGYGVRMSALADLGQEASTLERYRLTFVYRKPLHENWIYLQVEPELEWRNENDWKTIPLIRVGVDVMFWDVGQR